MEPARMPLNPRTTLAAGSLLEIKKSIPAPTARVRQWAAVTHQNCPLSSALTLRQLA
jgi:hypothetical protein